MLSRAATFVRSRPILCPHSHNCFLLFKKHANPEPHPAAANRPLTPQPTLGTEPNVEVLHYEVALRDASCELQAITAALCKKRRAAIEMAALTVLFL